MPILPPAHPEELGWEPLYERREKRKLILMYKIINEHTPNYLSDIVQPYAENVHNYNLRQQISMENLRLPHCNTVSYNKSFFYLVLLVCGMNYLPQRKLVLLLKHLKKSCILT